MSSEEARSSVVVLWSMCQTSKDSPRRSPMLGVCNCSGQTATTSLPTPCHVATVSSLTIAVFLHYRRNRQLPGTPSFFRCRRLPSARRTFPPIHFSRQALMMSLRCCSFVSRPRVFSSIEELYRTLSTESAALLDVIVLIADPFPLPPVIIIALYRSSPTYVTNAAYQRHQSPSTTRTVTTFGCYTFCLLVTNR